MKDTDKLCPMTKDICVESDCRWWVCDDDGEGFCTTALLTLMLMGIHDELAMLRKCATDQQK